MSDAEASTTDNNKCYVAFMWRGITYSVKFKSQEEAQKAINEMMRIGGRFADVAAASSAAVIKVETDRLRARLGDISSAKGRTICIQHQARWNFAVAALLALGPSAELDGEIGMTLSSH